MTRCEYERRVRRLGRNALAVLSGVSEGTIALIETGMYTPNDETLEKLARAFGVTPGSILMKEVSIRADPEERAVDLGAAR